MPRDLPYGAQVMTKASTTGLMRAMAETGSCTSCLSWTRSLYEVSTPSHSRPGPLSDVPYIPADLGVQYSNFFIRLCYIMDLSSPFI